ncbi:MAG: T9SS type A sorting domain-containing protein, partial [Candidatus Marinimicrobia bacterium]|nr:T9SS type A sorting domain-containing protein [Candidatus Neomarinimicrobiota bacterium]
SDGAAEDHFGFSVTISGDYAVVGAGYDDDIGDQSGSAYVFKRTGTSWTQEAKLLPSDGAALDHFGSSVSISGDYAVVGATGDDDNAPDAGSAYLFKRSGTSWTQEAKILASDGATGDYFGLSGSASISGDYAVVGAFDADDNGSGSGSAYVYNGFIPAVGVEDEIAGLPAEFALSQNYPNPFNPVTVIRYSIPKAEEVSLVVYNLIGEEVAHLIDERKPAGSYTVKWNASDFASGIYFYRLQAGDFVQTRKMVLLK